MDRRLVDGLLTVGATRSFDGILGNRNARFAVGSEERSVFAVDSVLEVEQEVGTDTIHPTLRNLALRLILEHNTSDVDAVRVELGRRGDRVVPGLKTRNGRDDNVEGDVPDSCVRRGR